MSIQSPTIRDDGSRRWIYPDRRSGYYSRLRGWLAFVLIVIYILTPFLEFRGRPLLRFDVMSGNIFYVGNVFRYVDVSYLAFIFLLAALGLFLATSVKGRLWCGFACPQTVFIDWIVRPLEEWLEGSAHHRRNQDTRPMTIGLFARKLFKHLLIFGLACFLSNVLLTYFVEPKVLMGWASSNPQLHLASFVVMLTISLALYFDLAWFREQFCAFLCPYARFQSVVMDSNTPAVNYDIRRGEPRGKKNTGDCIDCGLCVRVCPTGIDIRNGLQLECIQCYRCVDACNIIMASLKRPPNLIASLSQDELEGQKRSYFKPKTIFLSLAFFGVLSFLVIKMVSQKPLNMVLVRQPGAVFTKLENGDYTNVFTLDVVNTQDKTMNLKFDIESVHPESVHLKCGGCEEALKPFEKRKVALIFTTQDLSVSKLVLRHEASGESIDVPLILPAQL